MTFHDRDGLTQAICRVMDRIKTVERIVKQRIVVQEKRGHWTPVSEPIGDEAVTA